MTKCRNLIVPAIAAVALALSACAGAGRPLPTASPAPAVQAQPPLPAGSPSSTASSPSPAAAPQPQAPTGSPPAALAPSSKAPAPAPAKPSLPAAAPPVAPPAASPPAASATVPSAKPRRLGEIVYAEGSLSIRRGEKLLTGADADIGATILAYDLVTTGPGSRAEIDLGSAASGGALIKISEKTAFYFDTSTGDDGSRSTLVKLLAGSIAFKVEKLSGTSSFVLHSGDAVLGVRGTTFAVDSSPDGSILVSCAEGLVSCSGSDGRAFQAKPGTVVQGGSDGSLAPKPLPVEKLGAGRAAWLVDAEAAVGRNGAAMVLAASKALAGARPAFDAAFASLDDLAPTLAGWERLVAAGRSLGPAERLDERKALATALLVCLKALPAFETAWYRLADLSARQAAGATLGGPAAALSALDQNLAAFAASRPGDEARLGRLRRALYVFSRLEAGTPLGEFFAEKAASGNGQ
jgi:hypothetical protein